MKRYLLYGMLFWASAVGCAEFDSSFRMVDVTLCHQNYSMQKDATQSTYLYLTDCQKKDIPI